MKLKQTLFGLLALVVITASSCKDEDIPFKDSLSNTTFVGTFDGIPVAIKFGEDTKVTLLDGGLDADVDHTYKGSYAYSSNVVLFSVVNVNDATIRFSFSGTLNANVISGTFGQGALTVGDSFTVTKQ